MKDYLKKLGMKLSQSRLTGKQMLSRKATINEGMSTEKRVYQTYYGVELQTTEQRILQDSIIIEGISGEPGEPEYLRIKTMSQNGFKAEGPSQMAELLVLLLDAASYAQGIGPQEYAETVIMRAGASNSVRK